MNLEQWNLQSENLVRTHTQGYKQRVCGLMDLLDTDGNVKVETTLIV